MTEIFLKMINMSISASFTVLAVLFLRLLLKKAPKWITVLLWGIVAIRLLCPVSIESVMSLIPSAQTISKPPESLRPYFTSGFTAIDDQVNHYLSDHYAEGVTRPTGNFTNIAAILSIVWLVGIVALFAYTVISCIRLRKKTGTAVLLRDNIFQSENVVSPFVLGMLRPKIYLPFAISEQNMEQVIAHEQSHIRRRDHLWKPLGFFLLSLHWFNPLMWLGYVLLCRDIELACDEKVIKELSTEQRADYSEALLACSVNRRMIAACPLAFGEVGVKDRVKSVLNYRKPAFWIIIAAGIASVAAAVCFLTNPLSNRLKNIEDLTINARIEETVAVWAGDGEFYQSMGAVSQDLLQDLSDVQISEKKISQNRGEGRDKSHTLILQRKDDVEPIDESLNGLYIHFNSDFTSVWVNGGLKPTYSYRVIHPQKAKKVYYAIKNGLNETLERFYQVTPPDQIAEKYDRGEFVITKLHYKTEEGWFSEGHCYPYRLEISGKLSNAAKNTTYIVLSNTKDITFDQVWKASGLSSNTADYFDPKDAIIVGSRDFSYPSYEEELAALQALSPADIREIDIVYIRPIDGGERVYKTFSKKDDIQDILSILNTSDIHTSSISQEPTGGWTLSLRMWQANTGNSVMQPILISFGSSNSSTVNIGSYKYSIGKMDCYDHLLSFFEASAIEEKPYYQ